MDHENFSTILLADLFAGIREKISGCSLKDIANEYMHQLQQRGHVKFTTIEEKKKDFGNKSLIDCGPWVTGEILHRKILKIYSMAKSISHTHCLLWVFNSILVRTSWVDISLPISNKGGLLDVKSNLTPMYN